MKEIIKPAGFCTVLYFLLFSVVFSVPLSASGNNEAPKTSWRLSGGIRHGEDLIFLSRYRLFDSGKTIIPLFMTTPEKTHYENLSLYRLSAYQSPDKAELEQLWTYEKAGAGHIYIEYCQYAVSDIKIHFALPSFYPSTNEGAQADLIISYDIESGKAERTSADAILETCQFSYKPEQYIKAALVQVACSRIPFETWDVASPLNYSSASMRDLQRALLKKTGDLYFREAALSRLDQLADQGQMQRFLRQIDSEEDNEYTQYLRVMTQMSRTLRATLNESIFTAAYENNRDLLHRYLEEGADPNTYDEHGVSLLRYALFGNAPGTLRLLFEFGADPAKDPQSSLAVWNYAAGSRLRALYLELTGH